MTPRPTHTLAVPPPAGERPSRAGPLALGVVLAGAIATAAVTSFTASARALRAEKEAEVAAVAALKVEQLERWRIERIADVETLAMDPMLAAALRGNDPAAADRVLRRFRALLHLADYAQVELVDLGPRVVASVGGPRRREGHLSALAGEAIRSGHLVFSELHADSAGQLHLRLAAPVSGDDGVAVGAVLVRIDPAAYLLPLLRSWPVPGTSAESFLARRDGDALLALTPVRGVPGTALALRIPVVEPGGFAPPPIRTDGTGQALLSAARPVAGSEWVLVAELPAAAAFAPLRETALLRILVATALLGAVVSGSWVWWRHRIATFDRQRLVAEAERNAVARRLERLTRWSNDLVFLTDASHRIIEVNDRVTEASGFSRDELLQMTIPDLRDPATVADFGQRVRDQQSQGALVFETRYRRKDGSTFPVEVSAHVDEVDGRRFYQGVVRDLSAREQADRALRASEAKFRAAFEGARLGIALLDADARIVEANGALCEMLGREEAALRGTSLADVLEGAAPELAQAVARVASGALPAHEGALRLLRADGATLDGVLRASALRADAEGGCRALALLEDVSEKKQLQARLHLADRMASLGTLAAGVAHEINNPLAFVLANLDFALGELRQGGDRELVAALEDARSGGVRVREIVRELRTFTRAADEEGRADLRAAVRSAVALAANQLRHRARLVLALDEAPPVRANEHRLGQVALNLLVNAAQAIPEGDADRSVIRVTTGAVEGRALLEVSDTGAGIPPDVLPRIFDPFFTTKPVGVGTGLGLSICHAIVTGLGGEIRVTSAPGTGTTFRVLLPSAAGDAAPAPHPAPPATVARRARVLVVDDEPLVGRAVQRVLEPGHDVTVHTAAGDALAALTRDPAVDVVLCDLMMPGMSGMELHAHVRARAPALADRFVFLTGGAFTPAARAFLDAIPNTRLEKPFDPESLRTAVAQVATAAAAERA